MHRCRSVGNASLDRHVVEATFRDLHLHQRCRSAGRGGVMQHGTDSAPWPFREQTVAKWRGRSRLPSAEGRAVAAVDSPDLVQWRVEPPPEPLCEGAPARCPPHHVRRPHLQLTSPLPAQVGNHEACGSTSSSSRRIGRQRQRVRGLRPPYIDAANAGKPSVALSPAWRQTKTAGGSPSSRQPPLPSVSADR